MAEIKIEKKTPIWPWIIAVLLILALLYYFFIYKNQDMTDDDMNSNDTITQIDNSVNDNRMTENNAQTITNGAMIGSIAAYETLIADPNMTMDHTFTSNAINKLITATNDVADKVSVDVKADLDAARSEADAIEKDPKSLDHAKKIKDAAMKIGAAMKTIQSQKFEGLEYSVKNVNDAAMAINEKVETLNQKDKIKSFLTNAKDVLIKMDIDLQNMNNQ